MIFLRRGSLRIFRAFGISVFVHWSWVLAAVVLIYFNRQPGENLAFPVLEYLALFAIVIMHEFGHALACRSVGGKADTIILWPLGGVALVDPPPRPGAMLWSLAAGPLVNVGLLPVFWGLYFLASTGSNQLFTEFTQQLAVINTALLVFNMVPIYPLDGGQIVQALLWFFIGRWESLQVATIIGLCGAGLIAVAAFLWWIISPQSGAWWLVVMAAFALSMSWRSFKVAREMLRRQRQAHHGFAVCPGCGQHPPAGPFWKCGCGSQFDIFAGRGACPACGGQFGVIACPNCGRQSATGAWLSGEPALAGTMHGPT